MKIFDGKKQARKVEKKIIDILEKNSKVASKILAIVIIGEDASSEKFVKIKTRVCDRLGINYRIFNVSEDLDDEKIFNTVKEIFQNDDVGGGIIQLPLPRQSLYKVLDIIPIEKDIDLISTEGKDNFYSGDFSTLSPVIRAFKNFINENNIELKSTRATVVGDGELVGKPISFYLGKNGADVAVLSNYDGESPLDCDILILAAGVPNLVRGENISLGCHIVDFGSSVVGGKCVGDLDMGSDLEHLGCVSKSPGGMGPLVVSYLLLNHVSNPVLTCQSYS